MNIIVHNKTIFLLIEEKFHLNLLICAFCNDAATMEANDDPTTCRAAFATGLRAGANLTPNSCAPSGRVRSPVISKSVVAGDETTTDSARYCSATLLYSLWLKPFLGVVCCLLLGICTVIHLYSKKQINH